MTKQPSIEIAHLKDYLIAEYGDLLVGEGGGASREVNFLSKALGAFIISNIVGCGKEDAASSIVDGGGDGGIDAVLIDDDTLWLLQSKFIQDGLGEPALRDISRFRDGVENIIRGNYDEFRDNDGFKKKIPEIKEAMRRRGLKVRAILVYSGNSQMSPDRESIFNNLRASLDNSGEFLHFSAYNLNSLHEFILSHDRNFGVTCELELHSPASIERNERNDYKMYIGVVKLSDIKKLYDLHGDILLEGNIRGFKGETEVNEQIMETLIRRPKDFVYLNNGITAYCQSMEVLPQSRANSFVKSIDCIGLSIVNGGQTVRCISEALEDASEDHDGFVFMRIIALEEANRVDSISSKIAYSTNFQNSVSWKNLISMDEIQNNIALFLAKSGIEYDFKEGIGGNTALSHRFTYDEALAAQASFIDDRECEFCSRLLSNRRSLSNFDIHDKSKSEESLYRKLFNENTEPGKLWRHVLILREVARIMSERSRQESGIRRSFFESSRYLVAHVLAVRMKKMMNHSAMELSEEEVVAISREVDEISENIWTASELGMPTEIRAAKSIFSSAADCKRIREKTFRLLASRPEPSSVNYI